MPGKTRPYEQFGSFILFKKLESDALGDLFRAARIDDRHLGPLMAVRRLSGGNREALVQSAAEAKAVAPLLTGTSFVKEQTVDVANGIPFVAHEYGGGRSLRHIIDRARGGAGITPNPIPLDQAILIAEKVALSLATTAELRNGGARLSHGGVIPQFIWITDDGEIRVAGQQLGKGLVASIKDSKVAAAIGRYFAPELQTSGDPTQATEVYAMGALLYVLFTGNEPPDALHVSAFSQAIRAAKSVTGEPLPDDLRGLLEKSLAIDPSRRFPSVADMKNALSAIAHSGRYSATTFNLAFYLTTLLKKEIEGETIEREKESKINIAPYLEQQVELATPPAPAAVPKAARNKAPLYAAAAAALVAAAGGTFWAMRSMPRAAAHPAVRPKPAAVTQRAAQLPAAAVMIPPPAPAPPATASVDPAEQKKLFEQAVNQKLQEEMAKLQADFNKQMKQTKAPQRAQSAPPPVMTASMASQRDPQVLDDRTAPSAAALDERRLAARQEAAQNPPLLPQPSQQPAPAVVQPQAQPPLQPQPQPQPQPQAAAPVQPAAPVIHEGDLVDFNDVDVKPQVLSRPMLSYPPMAVRQKVQTLLILSVLVSENGTVQDVHILRGDPRFGFNDEAVRLLRGTRFSPAMKDGKRVKTWIPQPVEFKLQ
ncbi:MAG TPA: TonB family protein [Thermoanaerobaculia bacterium]|nr:TonB family protein [Thermoanaerobaculia bacterium]